VKLGHNVVSEYFAQDQYKVLDPESRMLDEINAAAPKVPAVQLRSLLGCFLFSGDDVFKPLGVLSGGERNRFALAKILVSPSNFLLLDEPTNHLDMRAKDVLLEAIAAFSGTVVFVSHDRYFIDRLATRVIEVEAGAITTYEGNYEDYLRRKEALTAASSNDTQKNESTKSAGAPGPSHLGTGGRNPSATSANPTALANSASSADNANSAHPQEASEPSKKRLNPIKLKQMQERCDFLEEEVPRIESSITHTEQQLGNFISAEETQRQSTLLESLRTQLNELTAEWEELTMQLEEQE
jgi:ATP-binding cassette subfamily F protein 3